MKKSHGKLFFIYSIFTSLFLVCFHILLILEMMNILVVDIERLHVLFGYLCFHLWILSFFFSFFLFWLLDEMFVLLINLLFGCFSSLAWFDSVHLLGCFLLLKLIELIMIWGSFGFEVFDHLLLIFWEFFPFVLMFLKMLWTIF